MEALAVGAKVAAVLAAASMAVVAMAMAVVAMAMAVGAVVVTPPGAETAGVLLPLCAACDDGDQDEERRKSRTRASLGHRCGRAR